jgi:hypothetical protein
MSINVKKRHYVLNTSEFLKEPDLKNQTTDAGFTIGMRHFDCDKVFLSTENRAT